MCPTTDTLKMINQRTRTVDPYFNALNTSPPPSSPAVTNLGFLPGLSASLKLSPGVRLSLEPWGLVRGSEQ